MKILLTLLVLVVLGVLATPRTIRVWAGTYEGSEVAYVTSFYEGQRATPEARRVRSIEEQVMSMLAEAGIDTVKAHRIIGCESTWNPKAYNKNKNGSNDAGLWQINSIHGVSDAIRFDPIKSTEFAIKLIKEQGFKPWVCQ